MKDKALKIIVCVVVFVSALAGGYYLYGKLSEDYLNTELSDYDVTQAPDISVYDSQGNVLTLDSLKGKPVVLNFWATWCLPCKSEMTYFEKAYKKYGDDVCFLLVNMSESWNDTKSEVQEFLDKKKYTVPIYYDSDATAAEAYKIHSIPQTFFINASGDIVDCSRGAVTKHELFTKIDFLIK